MKPMKLSLTELESIAPENIDESAASEISDIYLGAKDIYVRRLCLRLLYDKSFGFLENFFDKAFRKERYLDMRVYALRGLAPFRTEEAVAKLLLKINETLKKRATSTAYNYQEYECLLGKNALPYLVGRYNYDCLRQTLAIVQSNYDAMPAVFKGHFTIGEDGKVVALRSADESKQMLDQFFATKQ